MALNQTKALERASQQLAKHMQRDYSAIRMTDHYLQRKRRPDPAIISVVRLADELLRPYFDEIIDLENELALLQLRVRTCQEETRDLADYVRAIPARLPAHLDREFDAIQFRAWLVDQVNSAPLPHYVKPHQEPRK